MLVVDCNPNAALLGPVATELKRRLNYPREFFFKECTVQSG